MPSDSDSELEVWDGPFPATEADNAPSVHKEPRRLKKKKEGRYYNSSPSPPSLPHGSKRPISSISSSYDLSNPQSKLGENSIISAPNGNGNGNGNKDGNSYKNGNGNGNGNGNKDGNRNKNGNGGKNRRPVNKFTKRGNDTSLPVQATKIKVGSSIDPSIRGELSKKVASHNRASPMTTTVGTALPSQSISSFPSSQSLIKAEQRVGPSRAGPSNRRPSPPTLSHAAPSSYGNDDYSAYGFVGMLSRAAGSLFGRENLIGQSYDAYGGAIVKLEVHDENQFKVQIFRNAKTFSLNPDEMTEAVFSGSSAVIDIEHKPADSWQKSVRVKMNKACKSLGFPVAEFVEEEQCYFLPMQCYEATESGIASTSGYRSAEFNLIKIPRENFIAIEKMRMEAEAAKNGNGPTSDNLMKMAGLPPDDEKKPSAEREKWECVCSMMNDPDAETCAFCDSPKPEPDMSHTAYDSVGVPSLIANSLAPFQRISCAFAIERGGTAFLCDEMGLGKTVQSISIMSAFCRDWPLLIVTPSGARFHWETEVLKWLAEPQRDVNEGKRRKREEEKAARKRAKERRQRKRRKEKEDARRRVKSENQFMLEMNKHSTEVEYCDDCDGSLDGTAYGELGDFCQECCKSRVDSKLSNISDDSISDDDRSGCDDSDYDRSYGDSPGDESDDESIERVNNGGARAAATVTGDGNDSESDSSIEIVDESGHVIMSSPSRRARRQVKEEQGRIPSPAPQRAARRNFKPNEFYVRESEIVVCDSGTGIVWNENTKVVVCSYGLLVNLIKNKLVIPYDSVAAEVRANKIRMFKAIIVDESHMLKNPESQRTKAILPLLLSAKRRLLLSGTPALAKPIDLIPQLQAIDNTNSKMWSSVATFRRKYCNGGKAPFASNLKELNTLLSATVMIRRLKIDELTSLPPKTRAKCFIDMRSVDSELATSILFLMKVLKENGKGVCAKIGREQEAEEKLNDDVGETIPMISVAEANLMVELKVAQVSGDRMKKERVREKLQENVRHGYIDGNLIEYPNAKEQVSHPKQKKLLQFPTIMPTLVLTIMPPLILKRMSVFAPNCRLFSVQGSS